MKLSPKDNYACYLGDGVYATFDGFQVWLDCRAQYSEPGKYEFSCNRSGFPSIALEPDVMKRLLEYTKSAREQYTDPPITNT